MDIWIHFLFISLIIFSLIINYLTWFKDLGEKTYKKWREYPPTSWQSREEFMFMHKGGAIVFLLSSVGIYVLVLIYP